MALHKKKNNNKKKNNLLWSHNHFATAFTLEYVISVHTVLYILSTYCMNIITESKLCVNNVVCIVCVYQFTLQSTYSKYNPSAK